ncbi:DMT family transporter [uncultured Desulfobacter sp.]|uniref:DMT family transporter n=1 Tax=uncultured Desulfobacter sp. TaxID=240139 RepID=UPI0029F481DD|nr:DMT family transporter [uncultured Desulfobacter sp.]
MPSATMTTTPLHHTRGLILIHIAVFLFGFAGLFGKFIDCTPLWIVLGRTIFASLALIIYAKLFSCTSLKVATSKDLGFFVLQGILLALHWLSFFAAIQVSSVAVGLLTFSSFPLFVTFMEPLFFKEPFKKVDVLTAVAVFAGIILVVPDMDFSNKVTLGSFYGLISGFTFAVLGLVNRRNARHCHPVSAAFYQNLFAALSLITPVLVIQTPPPTPHDVFLLALLGVVFTALAHACFITGLIRIRVQTASVIAGMEPVYGILFAFILLGEIPNFSTLAGGILIIGAVISAGLLEKTKTRYKA